MQNLIEKYKLEIDKDLDEIMAAVEKHQKKQMAAVGEMGNERKETLPMTQKSNQ